ncbi:parB-like partition protein [Deinococcus phoenicis]|uniref:ParB-like partition protein n=1 Tax=Deinococcus phoenicis TaxID=1476583 RepID=A0A016QQ86_9DEIO|nr:ParB/RepB/Spo0J family partition protein [Deinococcus phoenicis]EYB68136.1 parB-like partition protein [Deinococcus phoenicis]
MTRRRPERRGNLAGLLGDAQGLTQTTEHGRALPLSELRPYAGQPRRQFGEAELEALTQSIREQGVLQPLLVRPAPGGGYEIAAGERRYRAALAAGLQEVPALVRQLDDQQMLEVGLVENLQRENLNPLDEIEGALRLLALRLNVAPQEARQRLIANLRHEAEADVAVFAQVFSLLGRETWQSFAKNKLRVLQWPAEVLTAMRERGLTYSAAAVIASAPEDHRPALLERALAGATRQELRAFLTSLTPVRKRAGTSKKQLDHLGRTFGSVRWFNGLTDQQRTDLDRWLKRMPTWLQAED